MGKNNYTPAQITDFIYTEYIFDRELNTTSDLKKYVSILVDNGKAVEISGTDDIYYSRLSRYKVASKFFIKMDKSLKKSIKPLLPNEEKSCINKADETSDEIVKLVKSGLDFGTYSLILEDKKSQEYGIFIVEPGSEYDAYRIKYEIYFIGEKCEKYKDKFFKMCDKYKKLYDKKDKDVNIIHYSESDIEKEVTFKSFDQMIFKQKDDILQYVDNWIENIPTYYKYGMNPKLSILLHGKPGTGKSTFYKALAKYLNITTIENIEPEFFIYKNNKDDNNSSRRGNGETDSKIYAIDEIDCICKTRTSKSDDKDNDKVLSKLLSFLDNPPTFFYKAKDGKYYPISIVVATTNYIDKIDPAVKRFGRFDLQIELVDFDINEAKEFCKLYDLKLSDVIDKVEKDFTISPAKLQALCMENIDKAIKNKGGINT